jgi:hypothetical protein
MDLTPTLRSHDLAERLLAFMQDFVYPAEDAYARQRREGDVDGPDEVHLRSITRHEVSWSGSGQRGGGIGGDLRVHADGPGVLRAEAGRHDLHA